MMPDEEQIAALLKTEQEEDRSGESLDWGMVFLAVYTLLALATIFLGDSL